MPRLVRHPRAFTRYMQMSKTTVFVFVEGHDQDPYFYGRLCGRVFDAAGISYEIVPGYLLRESGGKQVLLTFFNYLSTIGCLRSTFQGKRFAAFFFVDKDLDGIVGSRTNSDHLIYTEYYCIENHLFVSGDIAGAAAAASSLERREIETRIGNSREWRRNSAEMWKDWVVFCVFSHKHGIQWECTYRRARSIINDPPYTVANPTIVLQYQNDLFQRSGMTKDEFNKAFNRVIRL